MVAKILVVDDDVAVLRFLTLALDNEGYEVTSADNGLQALGLAQQDPPDLAILDVMLPGIDGLEVCHRIKTDERTSEIPVLMYSAKGSKTDLLEADKVGADDYLVKPTDLPYFLEVVSFLISESD